MPSLRSIANAGHALAWTAFMVSVAFPVFAVTGDRKRFQRAQRFWADGLAKAWGMEVHATGIEQLDPSQSYVFMANHLSHADIVALLVALPMNVGFLAKKELSKVPFLAQAILAGGHVLIDRQDNASALSSMAQAAQEVASGRPLVIFPEGTRASREVIQPLKKGGFHLARQARVPLVPVGIRGTRAIMGKEDLTIRPGKVEVNVGKPVYADTFENQLLCSNHVRKQLSELSGYPFAELGA
ncbi:MAG TPA: lysophospholipid acyltransferase family protein [Polyangiales bacterium]|nr:lysophospholipid acyltransferase family protein [Polyangiales bacterium]